MRWTSVVGAILLLLGGVIVVWGGIPLGERQHEMDAGPIEMRVEEERSVTVPRIIGGVIVLAGIAVIVAGRRGGAAAG